MLDRRLDADTLLGSDDDNDGNDDADARDEYKLEPMDGIAASESVPCRYGDGVGKALVAIGADRDGVGKALVALGADRDPDLDPDRGAEEEEVADDDVVALLCCFLDFLRRAILMAV